MKFYSFQCLDTPNVVNRIVCLNCEGAGHIAWNCRYKKLGMRGPAAPRALTGNAALRLDKNEIT